MLGDVYLSDEDEQSTPPTVPAMQPYQQQQPASSRVTAPVTSATKVAPPPLASFKAALSQPSALAPTKTVASLQPAPAAAAKVQNSHKKNEPLPPIPQSHYEQAARQMQMSRAPCPPALVDDKKMDPNNPEGLTSLWVGNVQQTVSQEDLQDMFSRYGKLQSIRILPEKFCAFVNYVSKDCAGRAMQGLQGQVLAGQPLLIKFPDNPVTSYGSTISIEKPPKSVDQAKSIPVQTLSKVQQASTGTATTVAMTKLRGPVNGDECYFWRTTGCQFTTGCRYRHVPDHKGIDKKPWQRVAK
jgi:hypothetical protein